MENEKIYTEQDVSDLIAENDSLKAENTEMLERVKKAEEELKKAKELNFTLGRKLSRETAANGDAFFDTLFKRR